MAYEDQRTILPTGLLSTASKPKYTPKPITLSFPTSGKPDPEHKNPDKELQRQKRIQQQQLEASQGGGKVICTEFWLNGYMPDEIYEADQLYGELLFRQNKKFMEWYHSNATWWLNKMRGNKLHNRVFTRLLWLFVKPWSLAMAHDMGIIKKDNKFGRFLINSGFIVFRFSKHGTIQDRF